MLAYDREYSQLEDISAADFEYFRKQIFKLAGISMSDAKKELVRTRLRSRVINLNLSSFKKYRAYLESLPSHDQEWQAFINVLTTNKTDWFREPEHFQYLTKNFLPQWIKQGKKHLRVWCAASSTGEEPYTLALVLGAFFNTHPQLSFEIIASDIDTKVLDVARNGVYSVDRLYQIPQEFHHLVVKGSGELSPWFRLGKELKFKVKFKQINLVSHEYPLDSKFDLVFCRNVLIYFDTETIGKVSKTIFRYCNDDAVFVIGHSETLQNTQSPWTYLKPSIYSKGSSF